MSTDPAPKSVFGWLRPVLAVFLIALVITTLGRIGILFWLQDRVTAAGLQHLPFVLLQGLRFDLLTLGVLFGIPVTLSPLMLTTRILTPAWMRLLWLYSLVAIAALLFMELATPSFINEFDSKPDRRFIEYLIYPKEVLATLWGEYKLPLLIAAVALVLLLRAAGKALLPRFKNVGPVPLWAPVLLVPLLAFATLAAVRSTNDHRPVNPSTVVYSRDPLANQFALNSTYTALYAAYELNKEDDDFAYQDVSVAEAIKAVREDMRIPASDFSGPETSTLHHQVVPDRGTRPLNLIIVLEESLGAEFVGSLGGLPLTPELDQLQHEGLWFDHLYATGVRSVRGIEAVVTGFLPTPASSVVKRPRAQRDFFTLAGLLETKGYVTSFLYGGEPQFDNMGRFFANNGFQAIVGRHDFTGEVFDGAWGAADEDLFRIAHERFLAMPADQPFFSLVFTTSNHSPWDFPEDRIELYESPKATRNNAVKYADHALGDFIRTVRSSPYWENTVILVISDHCSRVYGADLVPIERFHIPGVILGANIEPARVERVVSQIDMLPTLLSLMGVSSEHPAPGIDQTRTDLGDFPGQAIMQYGANQAYLLGDTAVVLQKGLPPGQYDYVEGQLKPVTADPQFLQHAVAVANWPWLSYRDGTYRLGGT